ncbi:hypothetical protein KFE98_14485 [bacterium SCSIO 12741]|nr:hypothetical protein KFE98_14485 [bacterium SCSIO 12741]
MENSQQEHQAGKRKVSRKRLRFLFLFALVFTLLRIGFYFFPEPVEALWVQFLWIPGVLFLMALPFFLIENLLDRFFDR